MVVGEERDLESRRTGPSGACDCSLDGCLTTEAVEGAALALEGVDHIQSSHSLTTGVLSVGHGIAHDVLKEHLEDTAGLLVDETRDTLDTTTASQTTDCGLLQIQIVVEKRSRDDNIMRYLLLVDCVVLSKSENEEGKGAERAAARPVLSICLKILTVMPWMLSRNTFL